MREDDDPIDVNLRAAWPSTGAPPERFVDGVTTARVDEVWRAREHDAFVRGQRSARSRGLLVLVLVLVALLSGTVLIQGVWAGAVEVFDSREQVRRSERFGMFNNLDGGTAGRTLALSGGIVAVRPNGAVYRSGGTPGSVELTVRAGEVFVAPVDFVFDVIVGGVRVRLNRGGAASMQSDGHGGALIVVHNGDVSWTTDKNAGANVTWRPLPLGEATLVPHAPR